LEFGGEIELREGRTGIEFREGRTGIELREKWN